MTSTPASFPYGDTIEKEPRKERPRETRLENFEEIESPAPPATLATAAELMSGPTIAPAARILLYSPSEWETFIEEWVSLCLKPQFKEVLRLTGANDKGIDIAGFETEHRLNGSWVNFQCKHFDHPIMPGEAWVEIGKILWYSFNKDYTAPRRYYFVAPKGVGTTLGQYLANAPKLKSELTKAWDKSVKDKISDKKEIPLDGDFLTYVESFDFSIFSPMPVLDIIEQHRATPYFLPRFGGQLGKRPIPGAPPTEIEAHESMYVAKLLAAYADHTKKEIVDVPTLKSWSKLEDHFHRQREAFFHAESFRVFVRDKVEPGTFELLQDEIFQGVIDTHDGSHPDGYACVVAVTKAAQEISLSANPLAPSTFTKDRHGICHQLANQDKLSWTK